MCHVLVVCVTNVRKRLAHAISETCAHRLRSARARAKMNRIIASRPDCQREEEAEPRCTFGRCTSECHVIQCRDVTRSLQPGRSRCWRKDDSRIHIRKPFYSNRLRDSRMSFPQQIYYPTAKTIEQNSREFRRGSKVTE